MTIEPLDLEAAERRIYAPDAPYTHIVLREVPLLLAEIRRLRVLEGAQEGTGGPHSDEQARSVSEPQIGYATPQRGVQ